MSLCGARPDIEIRCIFHTQSGITDKKMSKVKRGYVDGFMHGDDNGNVLWGH